MNCSSLRHVRRRLPLNIFSLTFVQRCNRTSSAAAVQAQHPDIKKTRAAAITAPSDNHRVQNSRSHRDLRSAKDRHLLRIFRSRENDKIHSSKTAVEAARDEDRPSARPIPRLGGRGFGCLLDTTSDVESPSIPVARVFGKYGRIIRRSSDATVSTAVRSRMPPNEPLRPGIANNQAEEDQAASQSVDRNHKSVPAPMSKQPIIISSKMLDAFKNDIGKAVEKQDASRMEHIWAEARECVNEQSITQDNIELTSGLYAHILWGFTSIQRPNRAIQIWNEMVMKRIMPTLAMWDTMLDGFGAVRNTKGVDGIWKMMLEFGCHPDKRLWVTRIRALATSGSWRSSLRAFEEMATAWVREARKHTRRSDELDLTTMGDIGNVPKPSIEALNALVNGLVQAKQETQLAAERLPVALSWSRVLGLSMDTYTFNPIIRLALRDGNTELTQNLLEEMQRLGVKRDVATYTMIVQSVFSGGCPVEFHAEPSSQSDQMSPSSEDPFQRKLRTVYHIMQEAEESGVTANAYTLSAMISGLLKDVGNIEAAEALCKIMTTRGIPMSSQIYTSFVTAYFDLPSGPDIQRVVITWEQARADEGTVLDGIFYDRLVEGFARCGEVGKMRVALAQMGKSRRVPGWIALTEVIRALGKAGEWAAAEDIVQDVKAEERAVDRVRKGKGQKWFWDTARAMGFGDHLKTSTSFESSGKTEDTWANSASTGSAIPESLPVSTKSLR